MDKIYETISKKHTIDHFLKCCEVTYIRGESRGTSNNVGEQKRLNLKQFLLSYKRV